MLMSGAVALYGLSLVEVQAFVPASISRHTSASLRGAELREAAATSEPVSWRAGLQTVSTLLTVSACALASRQRRSRGAKRTQMMAEKMEGVKNPNLTYTAVLAQAATRSGETVAVTQDVMRIKNLLKDEVYNAELIFIMADNCDIGGNADMLTMGTKMLSKMGEMQSTVFPKFVIFLAKKKRLFQLRDVCLEYVSEMYKAEAIVPVTVFSAEALTDEQKENIKAKMIEKTNASDVKLVCQVDGGLLGGFMLEWGYVDAQNMEMPTEGVDLTFKSYLKRKAIADGFAGDF